MVRAKMQAQLMKGQHGHKLWFNAVWEGSMELQGVSENAIFGNSSPSGSLTLDAPMFPEVVARFVNHEEYFVDLFPSVEESDRWEGHDKNKRIISVAVRKTYRSEFNPSWAEHPITFRLVSLGYAPSDVVVQFEISITNPRAIEALDQYDQPYLAVRLARGRRSDAEIALRQKMLDDVLATPLQEAADPKNNYYRDARASWVADLTHKLALAKGEDPAPGVVTG